MLFTITEPYRNRFQVVAADQAAYDQLLRDVTTPGLPDCEPNVEALTITFRQFNSSRERTLRQTVALTESFETRRRAR